MSVHLRLWCNQFSYLKEKVAATAWLITVSVLRQCLVLIQCKRYDHVTSINSVTATKHEIMVKNGLLTEYETYHRKFSVVVLEKSPCPWGPIYTYLSLSSDLKSLSSSHKSLKATVLMICQPVWWISFPFDMSTGTWADSSTKHSSCSWLKW